MSSSEELISILELSENVSSCFPAHFGNQVALAEKRLLLSVIHKAIDDLKFLSTDIQEQNKEHRRYGREALIWLFVERIKNIDLLYLDPPEHRRRNITITTFENVCNWLQLDPSFIRKIILEKYSFTFLSPFIF
jgi:hypothetical protein